MRAALGAELKIVRTAAAMALAAAISASAFEGRITVAESGGGRSESLLYTVASNRLRIETASSDRPAPVDIYDTGTGAVTLLFPHNRSYVQLAAYPNEAAPSPGVPPQMPAGVGPQVMPPLSAGVPTTPGAPPPRGPVGVPGAPGGPGMPAMPAMPSASGVSGIPSNPGLPPTTGMPPAGMGGMPMMPSMPPEKLELKATGETTNILGLACKRFEIQQRLESMEIWATDQMPPLPPYRRNQPRRFGPKMLRDRWQPLLAEKKLFPMLAITRMQGGVERSRFEVTAVTPAKIDADSAELFQPPADYHETRPLPF